MATRPASAAPPSSMRAAPQRAFRSEPAGFASLPSQAATATQASRGLSGTASGVPLGVRHGLGWSWASHRKSTLKSY
jgi:hypothetical protein